MNVLQICNYLNEIGILDIENVKNYLSLISNINNNKSNDKSINDIYKISLFVFLRGINNSDKNLYLLCANVINSYNKYSLIKKYNFLNNFKRILYYRILQRFNYFIISIYKKFPFKNYKSNAYYKNKKNKVQNNTCSNNFYAKKNNSFQNLTENNNNKDSNFIKNNINSNQKINNLKLDIKNDNDYNIYTNNIDIQKDKRIYKELQPIKKSQISYMNMCINQSNINFEKYFINKRFVVCKKCRPSFIERIKTNRKEIYQSNNKLHKNKSETKLRIKKMDFEEKTRSENLAKIKPELKRKIKSRTKAKRDDEIYFKEKEDRLYNKFAEKEIDKNDVLDRLYRKKIADKIKGERKIKEEEVKNTKKPPINWDQVYLETNDRIANKIKNNNHKRNKTCSYFMPNRGRIYKYVEDEKDLNNIEVIKDDKNININLNKDINKKEEKNITVEYNEKDLKKEENDKNEKEEKNDNMKGDYIKKSFDSEKENKKTVENKEDDNNEEEEKADKNIHNNSLQESTNFNEEKMKNIADKFTISAGGFKSKDLQALLKKQSNNNNNGNNEIKDTEMNEENGRKLEISNGDDKMKLDDLLC